MTLSDSVSTFHYQTLGAITPSFIQQLLIDYLLCARHSSSDLEINMGANKTSIDPDRVKISVWR